jgi:hypothetical protein
MPENKFHHKAHHESEGGKRVTVNVMNVENTFIGLTIKESNGLNSRQVAAEISNLDDIKALRDVLSTFIDHVESQATTEGA